MDVNTLSQRINVVVDWFIHPALKGDRDRVNQARVFLISHLFGPFIGSAVPVALYLLDPEPGFKVGVLAASIFGFWVFPFLLKRFGHYNLLAIVSVENLIFCILWSCYWYGGVKSPTLPWVLTIPLLAFFYIGTSAFLRTVVIIQFALNVLVFIGIAMLWPPAPLDLANNYMEWLGIVSTIAVALYVTMMALYYAKVYESQAELEAEMRGHLATASELRRATSEAERAGAAKAEFLAKMSHELRTPLNAVINYSEMLLEDAVDEDDQETVSDLNKIHTAGQHLLKLINEVLDLSKIDAGMMSVYNQEVAVADIVRRAVDEARETAAANGNVVNVEIDPNLGVALIDQQKVQQILSQILDNAAKFTKGGIVSVHAYRTPDVTPGTMTVDVDDTGVGIAAEELPRLFEYFTVLGDASSSKYGGTGLGLALSQRLARLMGGDIRARSELGKGSTFSITLPLSPAGSEAGGPAPVKTSASIVGEVRAALKAQAAA